MTTEDIDGYPIAWSCPINLANDDNYRVNDIYDFEGTQLWRDETTSGFENFLF